MIKAPVAREVQVLLSITVAGDERTPGQIAEAIMGALEVGADDDSVRNLAVRLVLAQEIDW